MALFRRKDPKLELMKNVPLFARCSRKELEQIAAIADEVDLPAGRVLAREGEPGREFLIVLRGTVEATQDGRHVRTLRDGDFFGEIALVSDLPRTATVTATSPLRALVVTDRAFHALLERDPAIDAKIQETKDERLAAAPL